MIDKLSRVVREAVNSDEVIAAWRPLGVDPRDGGAGDLATLQESELKRWTEVAAAAGLKK